MSFAKNAVGFYLQVEDQLTPALDAAEGRYNSFIKKLTAANDRAVATIKKGQSALSAFVAGVAGMDEQVGAWAKKPLSKKVRLTFDAKEAAAFAKSVSRAVAHVLSRMKFNLTPAKTGKGMTGVLAGMPKFSAGGRVGPPAANVTAAGGGGDDQIIAAKTGEVVLPRRLADGLLDVLTRGPVGPGFAAGGTVPPPPGGAAGFKAQFVTSVQSLKASQKDFKDLTAAVKLGLATNDEYVAGQHALLRAQAKLDALVKHYDYATLRPFLKEIGKARDTTHELTDAVKADKKEWTSLLEKVLGPAKFLAVNKALGSLQAGLGHLSAAAHETFGGGAQRVDDFVTNFNSVNKMVGMTRAELHALKEQATADVKAFGGAFDLAEYSETFEALRRTGLTDVDLIHQMALAATAFETATTASKDTAAGLFNTLHYNTKLSVKDMTDLTAVIAKSSYATGADADQLAAHMRDNVHDMAGTLNALSNDTQKSLLANMEQFSAALVSESGDAGNELAGLMAKAIGGQGDALRQFNQLTGQVFGQDQLTKMVASGEGLDKVITGIAANAQKLGTTQFADLAGQIMPGIDVGSLARIGTRSDAIVSTFKDLRATSIEAGKGIGFLTEHALANETAWQRWIKQAGNVIGDLKLFGVSGVDVIDFLHEFGLQNLHATAYLAKLSIEFGVASIKAIGMGGVLGDVLGSLKKLGPWLASLIGWNVGVAESAGAAAIAVGAEETAAAAAVPANAALGATIAEVGAGVGVFLTEIGSGAGAGIAAFMGGLATGFMAFAAPPVILGVAVVTAAVLGLGLALRVAAPALAVGVDVVRALGEMNVGQMLAAGPALAMMGVGFTAMAAGVLAGSLLLLAAVPALGLASAAIGLLGGDGGAVGTAAGAGIGIVIAATVNSLAASLGMIDEAALKNVSPKVAAVAGFISDYAKIERAVGSVTPSGGLMGSIRDFFTGSALDDMLAIGTKSAMIQLAVNTLVNGVATWGDGSPEKIAEAGKRLGPVGEFLAAYAKVADGLRHGPGGLRTWAALGTTGGVGVWDAIVMVFTGDDVVKLANNVVTVRATASAIIRAFADPQFAGTIKNVPNAKAGIDGTIELMKSLDPLFKQSKATADIAATLEPGWFEAIFGGNGAMTTLADGVVKVKEMLKKVVPDMGAIAEVMASAKQGGVTLGIQEAAALMKDGVTLLAASGEFAAAYERYGASIDRMSESGREKVTLGVVGLVTAVQEVQHNLVAPALTPDQIKQAVTVSIEGHVDADDEVTHGLLSRIADLIQSYGPPATPAAASSPSGPTAGAAAFQEGRTG